MTTEIKLADFRLQNESVFDLRSIDIDIKKDVFDRSKNILINRSSDVIFDAIACLRIISRDTTFQSDFYDENILAALARESVGFKSGNHTEWNCLGEVLKCLSNIVYKNPSCISILKSISSDCLKHLIHRALFCPIEEIPIEIRVLDIKFIFLLTALDKEFRGDMLMEHFKSTVIVQYLENINNGSLESIELTNELLKFLFNLGYAIKETESSHNEFEDIYDKLVQQMRDLLLKDINHKSKKCELVTNIVNFLTTAPLRSLASLLFPEPVPQQPPDALIGASASSHLNKGVVRALSVLLDFLDEQLDLNERPGSTVITTESLNPILNVIASASRGNRTIRKYFRMAILPHLGKEVEMLPEEGDARRNKLCRLLTAKTASVAEPTAAVIYILCKENIGRAIKYSGFGNFSGFLTRHALLHGGGRASKKHHGSPKKLTSSCRELSLGDYSSTSSASETEDYVRLCDKVNPVTGRYELPKPSPMEGMSEEQKEYEVMKLVEKIDKLQRSGVIQPGTIGDDGRVCPVDHVLQLLENMPTKLPTEQDNKDV